MIPADHLVAPEEVWAAGEAGTPFVFVDMARAAEIGRLPPIPVIGVRDEKHPDSAAVDVIVEPSVSADTLVRNIEANPAAAAVTAQLLRSLDGVEPAAALTLESMAYGLLQNGTEHRAWLAAQSRQTAPAGSIHMTRRGGALSITLARPHARNAIDRGMRDALHEAFTLAALDSDIARVTLDATGPAFSIGGDLAEFGRVGSGLDGHLIRSRTLPTIPLLACRDRLHAHVQGACIGAGLEIAAFAARVTATPDAWFQLPELGMGLIPGAGGCVSVPLRIGRQRTALMILSGRRISARVALDWGLIDAIVDEPPADPGATDLDAG